MKTLHVLALLGTLATPRAAPAQDRSRQLTPGVVIKPQVEFVKRVQMRTVRLSHIPDSALHLQIWPGLQVARVAPAAPGAIGTAGATVYVAKRWQDPAPSSLNDACTEPRLRGGDEIDITEPRRHGFRLADVTITSLVPPQGYKTDNAPFRRGAYKDVNGNGTTDLDQVVRIPLSARRHHMFVLGAFSVPCFTGYRVDISLRGPADVDPFSGRRITRSQVN
ncbi:hypothetical protein [Sphingomonas psychrotolerans]|uniref:Uncharacterized protein n=1 Tax=Sphingomonas psychrotolerans TaxID=1327635 RepID=A0A2K8MB97_9SPHN|nr:hypothetical protein [Sphingomonas psychrotolerans]ATY31155.1 hypothetical protein CVN68_03470 [Sphingomonas psychrotolerans]